MTLPAILGTTALGLLLLIGCDRSSASPPPASPPPAPAPTTAPRAAPQANAFDQRTPVPLSPMMAAHQKEQMRDHLRVVQEIAGALAVENYEAIAASTGRIASSEQQSMMCAHMGAGAPGFAELGEELHRTADGIITAAKRRDRAAVAAALEATLTKCVGCHETYRQEIVEDE